MGYSTYFDGAFTIEPPVSADIAMRINAFTESRGGKGAPDSYNGWIVTPDGDELEHDGGEKFSDYVEWLVFLIDQLLKPNGHVVNGKVRWQGEEGDDSGVILVVDNVVKSAEDIRTNPLDAQQ